MPDTKPDDALARDVVAALGLVLWRADAARERHEIDAGSAVEIREEIAAWREPHGWEASVHPDDRPRVRAELEGLAPGGQRELRYRLRRADGTLADVREVVRAAPDGGDGALRGALSVLAPRRTPGTDSDAMRRHAVLPAHDVLTGLPNRAAFSEHLAGAAARAERHPGYLFAVLAVELDDFRVINESLGHRGGDAVTEELARRIAGCVRTGDVAARVGSDDYAILLDDLEDADRARHVAARVQAAVAEPLEVDGHELLTSCSVGIALAAGPLGSSDVLRDAVTALHRAQVRGRAQVEIFAPQHHDEAVETLRLATDMRRAFQRGEFEVQFQPIVRLDTGRLDGFESLVRWRHPERGLVQPSDFIPFAEDSGLVRELGARALESACAEAARWAEPGPKVSVNLSPRQLDSSTLVSDVERVLRSSGLPPRRLRLEITESAVMPGARAVIARLSALRRLGIQVQLDDFGTGYSSLAYLHQIPLDTVKLDKAFVQAGSAESRAIVRTIVALARTLGLSVVAEGIETVDQRDLVRDLGCDLGQGYLFSPPVEAEAARELAASGRTF